MSPELCVFAHKAKKEADISIVYDAGDQNNDETSLRSGFVGYLNKLLNQLIKYDLSLGFTISGLHGDLLTSNKSGSH